MDSPGQGDARSREAADGRRAGVSSPPTLDRQQVLRQTRARLHPERIARREDALARARVLIEGSLGRLDETGLRRLLQLFNADHVDGREVNNRFATGLVMSSGEDGVAV
ncbi:hypothetical protein [Sorangium sp. So ce1335]|uniref:hypothetical protein n=1 Tax=Sorangium sp. So ce1335 TaxID=3133335 RepID=UPI003F6135B4